MYVGNPQSDDTEHGPVRSVEPLVMEKELLLYEDGNAETFLESDLVCDLAEWI